MQILGQIPTPEKYVSLMLDEVGYQEQLLGKTFIDNSCGDGNILVEAVKRYISASKKEGYTGEIIKRNLECDIFGYDIDKKAVNTTIKRLNEIAGKEELYDVRWNVQTADYLKTDANKYDYIVGNPPYITYHDLTKMQREYVKKNFISCQEGRFDYCYAFIEKSIKSLTATGKMAYLIPFSIFRNRFAFDLRKQLLEKLYKIIDLSGIEVFPNRTVGVAIIICKNEDAEEVEYIHEENKANLIKKTTFDEKWVFERQPMAEKKFGDYFTVLNSVATLKNEVYLFEPEREDDNYYYFKDEKIEKIMAYTAVSPRSRQTNRNYKIIFPYKINEQNVERIKEEDFQIQYPFTYQYLLKRKKDLQGRTLDEKTTWYEYGRSQALSSMSSEKILIPMVVSNKLITYKENADSIPFAGYYITCKTSQYTLDDAKRILESQDFMNYIKAYGTPTTKTSYRISTLDIKNFRF